jgi:protein-tyrosine phosphatase
MTSLPFEPPIFTRRVELSGAVNFRDLGGYRSTDGRQVRWRQLYRSDSLADLTDADLDVLSGIGLRSVCDLRHESERVKRPDKLPSGSPASLHQIGFFPHRAESLFKRLADKDISASEVEEFLCAAYRAFPIAQRVIYKGVLDILVADGALPALIHCTSGKDRTGFGVAVVLMALGVPRDVIVADYLLTNEYRRDLAFMIGDGVDPAVQNALKQAHPSYLAAAFDTIDQHWGSDAAYIERGLGFSGEDQERLRSLLLA